MLLSVIRKNDLYWQVDCRTPIIVYIKKKILLRLFLLRFVPNVVQNTTWIFIIMIIVIIAIIVITYSAIIVVKRQFELFVSFFLKCVCIHTLFNSFSTFTFLLTNFGFVLPIWSVYSIKGSVRFYDRLFCFGNREDMNTSGNSSPLKSVHFRVFLQLLEEMIILRTDCNENFIYVFWLCVLAVCIAIFISAIKYK